jgi:hypothetical protein
VSGTLLRQLWIAREELEGPRQQAGILYFMTLPAGFVFLRPENTLLMTDLIVNRLDRLIFLYDPTFRTIFSGTYPRNIFHALPLG